MVVEGGEKARLSAGRLHRRVGESETRRLSAAMGRLDKPIPHGAGQMSERVRGAESRERISRRSQSSLARTNHAVLHAPAGRRSRPEMAIDAPHYAISMLGVGYHWRAATEVPGLAVGSARVVPYLATAPGILACIRVYLPVGRDTCVCWQL